MSLKAAGKPPPVRLNTAFGYLLVAVVDLSFEIEPDIETPEERSHTTQRRRPANSRVAPATFQHRAGPRRGLAGLERVTLDGERTIRPYVRIVVSSCPGVNDNRG